MGTQAQIQALRNSAQALDTVDVEKLERQTLGSESMATDLKPRLERIAQLKTLVLQCPELVNDESLGQMANLISGIANNLSQQAARNSSEYIANRGGTLTNVDALLEQSSKWKPDFIAAAIEQRGFLKDEGIRREYVRAVEEMRTQSQAALEEVQRESQRTISEAKKIADEMEQRARRSAAKISVQVAQDQFRDAQKDINKSLKVWAVLSVVSVVAFFSVLTSFFFAQVPADPERVQPLGWQVLYHALLRLAVLSALGAIAGYCLRNLRAYLNMRERNLHRQRVANSIEAFVISAQTPEVRDIILAQLVDAVVSFGVSGLLSRDSDSLGSHKIPADAATRLIGLLGKQGT